MAQAETCRYCPAPTHPHPHAVTCGATECKRLHNRDRARLHQRRYRAEAAARGESYRARWGWNSYGSSYRRRVLVNGPDADVIPRDALGERDGWMCGLCSGPIERGLSYPAPLSASIDHVLPLRSGGTHTWDNVQIAHNRCNVSKKANVDWTPEVPRGCSEDADQPREARQGPVVLDRSGLRASP